ncbi:hypothetical protein QKY00_000160 [Salmonella enterica]|uniref:Uncharacterized protein n=1 Tax=Salmonella enterica TaxID=28901 RepID=A0A3J3CR43_SALER|nr:hypothetical protein [Salmonella enterica]EAU5128794.1 hypothetical protein [Salmonella enterica subsp. enterica serovar Oranienburg]EAW1149063.1 hypothetical protein [Salmonella enterica subsp. houtenae]EBH8098421.1 hypothetical protein [Salmonella enterica subsp. houtenae serovar O:11:g,z25:-]EBI0038081.1 hypothetical protein [Salmonella enterica subsp. diarizonae serovar 61:k:z35]ECT3983031.1 hypothetical protein [Salmonella enterica subsp. houtenae serovar 53:z4,z23:-]ECU4769845.1 hypo
MEYKLLDILLTIRVIIFGAEGWEGIQVFGEAHIDFNFEWKGLKIVYGSIFLSGGKWRKER